MGLDTMHDREFYLAKAEEYPLLEEIIAGKKSFAGSLGEVLSAVEEKGGDALEDLRGYLTVLSELRRIVGMNPVYLEVAYSNFSQAAQEYAKWFKGGDNYNQINKKANALGFPSIATFIGGSILALLVPPAALAGVVLAGAGGLGAWGAAHVQTGGIHKKTKARSTFQEAVGPVHKAAGKLDLEVMQFFAVNKYTSARGHFEQMYPLLSDGQRQQVNTQLYAFLGAGGMPSMDETQLKEYLSGLLEPVVESEAAEPEG